jgi:hypothetical protein
MRPAVAALTSERRRGLGVFDALDERHRAMWPFRRRKKETMQYVAPEELSFSQVDITEGMDDNLRLGPDEWITTTALNTQVPDPPSQGLPPLGAGDDEVYRVADQLSRIREAIPLPADGVYCPICHIANVSLERLRTPCPRCGRELLKFGWT